MTRSLPKVPLWPRPGRSGWSRPALRSSRRVASGRPGPEWIGSSGMAVSLLHARGERRGLASQPAKAVHPADQGRLALPQPILDVRREDVAAARGPDAEGDGEGVLTLVGDADRDPRQPQLVGPGSRPPAQEDGRLAGGQPLDPDIQPADPAHAEPEHLAHRFLGRPPP